MAKKASYRVVNYALRPGKAIERKMLMETMGRLERIQALSGYQYVGFGSPYFSDFSLVHRSLGIGDLVCIEQNEEDEKRFLFNRPFSVVKMVFGQSSLVLPSMEFAKPAIVWLDYDGRLDEAKLSDINVVVSKLPKNSVILVSACCDPGELNQRRLRASQALGTHLPIKYSSDAQLGGWGLSSAFRDAITSQIEDSVDVRNTGVSTEDALTYHQLTYFNYTDSVPMMTVGGVIGGAELSKVLLDDLFGSLQHVRMTSDPFEIKVPSLTFREMHFLDTHLPGPLDVALADSGIPEPEAMIYAQMYRHFPRYANVEM